MDVSEDFQEAESYLSREWGNWRIDHSELESEEPSEVVVWNRRQQGERVQGWDDGSCRSSKTVDG